MKRQDVSGVERLAVDSTGGGGGSDVNLTGINGVTPSTGHGTADTGTLRVELPTDGTGQVKLAAGAAVIGHVITDSGSTTVVTGNVTVVQPTGTNLHAVLDSGTTTVTQGTGTNLHTVVDSGSITVTQGTGTNLHTVLDSGTLTSITNAVTVSQGIAANLNATVVGTGTFLVQAALNAGTNLIGKVSSSDETSTIYSGTTALTPKFAAISASSNGNNTVVAAGTNKIRVLAWNLMASGTVNVKWQSGAGGTDLTGLYYLIANTGISVPFSPVGYFETASATLLNLNLSGATAVGGNIVYIDVA